MGTLLSHGSEVISYYSECLLRASHRHMRHPQRFEPVTHLQHLSRHGAKRPRRFVWLPAGRIRRVRAGYHRPLVDIQARTSFIDNLHLFSLPELFDHTQDGQWDARLGSKFPLRASLTGATDSGACRHPDHSVGPAHSTSVLPIFDIASILPPFYPFSCAVVRRRRMIHCWRMFFVKYWVPDSFLHTSQDTTVVSDRLLLTY